MEVRVIDPMYHDGKPLKAGEIIDIKSIADVQYLVGIGRVEEVEAVEAEAPKPKPARKAKES